MKSPITGNEMKLIKDHGVLTYRKEDFKIVYHYYLCDESNEHFTTDEVDTVNMVQVYNQYREKYRVPFPDEIVNIREKYNVSAMKMSEILGLGANTYRLYETGEMPSVANGRLILSVKEPTEFLRQVDASAHLLNPRETDRIKSTASDLLERERKSPWNRMFEEKIFTRQSPDEFTGYREPKLAKIAHVIAFFSNCMDLYKTKLNKLFFYSDFCNYRDTGYSITGITYRAIQYGPVPAEYNKLYIKLCDDEQISVTEKDLGQGIFVEQIRSCKTFDPSLFSKSELKVLELIALTFKDKNTPEIVSKSHEETAWTENKDNKNFISYQKYAFSLIGIK